MMRSRSTNTILSVAAIAFWLIPLELDAAYLRNVPLTVVQPGGDTLHIYVTGDEYYNRLHDAAGYTVVRNSTTGYFEYAILVQGKIVPGGAIVGRSNPAALGIPRNVIAPPAVREGLRRAALGRRTAKGSPTTGTLQNLVVFVRFSDQEEFP
ncbi:MAG TPA: hypothetical protein VMF59_10900, partial [Bacteroidota bacterium]|nr:hypothetical protein [Bacteroidota bacterium]